MRRFLFFAFIFVACAFVTASLSGLSAIYLSSSHAATLQRGENGNTEQITFPKVIWCKHYDNAQFLAERIKQYGTPERSSLVLGVFKKLQQAKQCVFVLELPVYEEDFELGSYVSVPKGVDAVTVFMLEAQRHEMPGTESYVLIVDSKTINSIFTECIMPFDGLQVHGAYRNVRCWIDS